MARARFNPNMKLEPVPGYNPPAVIKTEYVDRVREVVREVAVPVLQEVRVEVPGPERIVEIAGPTIYVDRPVEKIVYVDRDVPGPVVEVIKEVEAPAKIVEVERVVHAPPNFIDRIKVVEKIKVPTVLVVTLVAQTLVIIYLLV